MSLIAELRTRARDVIGPMLGVGAVVYFAYHAVNGDRGLMAWIELKDKVVAAETAAQAVAEERRAIANRVGLLHPEHLDPDMVEERARVMLNFAYAGDIVIMDKPRNEGRNKP